MELTEIIKDSFRYPFNDFKQFKWIFAIFVLVAIVFGGFLTSMAYLVNTNANVLFIGLFAVAVVIISIISFLIIGGYQLDIIDYACELEDDLPRLNPVKNIKNALKIILIYIVFQVIAFIIGLIGYSLVYPLLFTGETAGIAVALIIEIILLIINFVISWICLMSVCRLAYYGSLDDALHFRESYDDLRKIGILKFIAFSLVFYIIFSIIAIAILALSILIMLYVPQSIGPLLLLLIVFAIGSYLYVVYSRAVGLLYSGVIYDDL